MKIDPKDTLIAFVICFGWLFICLMALMWLEGGA